MAYIYCWLRKPMNTFGLDGLIVVEKNRSTGVWQHNAAQIPGNIA